jgi:hypothetical protein
MKTWLIGVGVAIVCSGLGVAAAYGGSELLKSCAPEIQPADQAEVPRIFRFARNRPGMLEKLSGRGMRMRDHSRFESEETEEHAPDRMEPRPFRSFDEEISYEDAVELANQVADRLGPDLELAKAMEFEQGYYFVFWEAETGRGAFEVLVDRSGRRIGLEPGPSMMWNLKYGMPMHRRSDAADNTLSQEEARQAAQEYLDRELPETALSDEGYAFYGYYTFAYTVDGKTAGILSVNGLDGSVWPHTWHGAFLSETEVAQ